MRPWDPSRVCPTHDFGFNLNSARARSLSASCCAEKGHAGAFGRLEVENLLVDDSKKVSTCGPDFLASDFRQPASAGLQVGNSMQEPPIPLL